MPPPIIRTLTPAITTFSLPFSRFNLIEVGARMTCVKLGNGDLVLYSPVQFSEEVGGVLDRAGRVRYLVCPNVVHHLYVGEYKTRYPDAKLIGVEGLPAKRKDLRFDYVMGETTSPHTTYGWESEIDHHYLPGSANKDLLLFHRPTRTLLTADLFFNLPAREQYSAEPSKGGLLTGLASRWARPESMGHKVMVWLMARDKKDVMKGARKVVWEWGPEMIVPCHGDVVVHDGTQKFREAFKWVL
ncbi:hypothetical protein HK104_002101 [Borealophlyctis nickersoniae]|nr:hypothetical protein HK104_002101 [Borealophlyctis nickersoniae]